MIQLGFAANIDVIVVIHDNFFTNSRVVSKFRCYKVGASAHCARVMSKWSIFTKAVIQPWNHCWPIRTGNRLNWSGICLHAHTSKGNCLNQICFEDGAMINGTFHSSWSSTIWSAYRLRLVPLWHSLFSVWDDMESSMINCNRLSSSVGLTLSASHLQEYNKNWSHME
jgi:hypothetical protein